MRAGVWSGRILACGGANSVLKTNARDPNLGENRPSRGQHCIDWIETHCVYTVGHWVKKRVRLLRWQKRFIMHLLEEDPETRVRRYRWVLLGMPKKNGKTELAAWLALYLLIGDNEPAAWIACAAASDNQANLVFGAAKRCAEWSPTLSLICETYDNQILVPSLPGAKLVRVTAAAGTNDGPSWHAVICDEFHEWSGKRGRDVWTVLTNGVGARRQPLIIQITTAGFDLEGTVCGEQYQLGEQLALDPTLDPRYLFWWYEAAKGTDYTDPKTWEEANPSWGATLPDPVAYLRDQLTKKTESEFKRYFLNLWVLSEDLWLKDGQWAQCARGDTALDPSRPLFVGIDGALKRDSFAVVAVQPQDEGRVVVRAWVWENPYPPGHELRAKWRLNLEEPLNKLRELFRDFPEPAVYDEKEGMLPGPAFGYDPRFLEYAAQRLSDEGLNMVEYPQTDPRMCPASELLYELVVTERLAHDGDPTLDRHVHGCVPKYKERGWRLAKPTGSSRRIDAAIALTIGVGVAFAQQEEETSVAEPELY